MILSTSRQVEFWLKGLKSIYGTHLACGSKLVPAWPIHVIQSFIFERINMFCFNFVVFLPILISYRDVSFLQLRLWAQPWDRPVLSACALSTTSRLSTASTCRPPLCRPLQSSRQCFLEMRTIGEGIRNVCCRPILFRPFLATIWVDHLTFGRFFFDESAVALCFSPIPKSKLWSSYLILSLKTDYTKAGKGRNMLSLEINKFRSFNASHNYGNTYSMLNN